MHADDRGLGRPSWQITDRILRTFYDVYNELGGGFLESVYPAAMRVAFAQAGIRFLAEAPVKVSFRGKEVGFFRADFIVDHAVVVELEAASRIEEAHRVQLLNYLRATDLQVGLLLNFGRRPEFSRLVYANAGKRVQTGGQAEPDPP